MAPCFLGHYCKLNWLIVSSLYAAEIYQHSWDMNSTTEINQKYKSNTVLIKPQANEHDNKGNGEIPYQTLTLMPKDKTFHLQKACITIPNALMLIDCWGEYIFH